MTNDANRTRQSKLLISCFDVGMDNRKRDTLMLLIRFGSDLLSHALRRSTISAAALNGRVRDGIGCFARAMTTKPKKQHQVPSQSD